MYRADSPPRGLLARLVRLPIALYRLHAGWLLGSRFLLLEHRGRKTGKRRTTVIEVIGKHPGEGTYYVAGAWGEHADWYRNILQDPQVRVTVGSRRFKAVARILSTDEARRVLEEYEREHSWSARGLRRWMKVSSLDEMIGRIPVVEFRRATAARKLS